MSSEYYGGLGPMVNAVLWVHVVIFAVFVALRLYTRIWIIQTVGWDDYLCALALAMHILYTIFVTIATQYGLGRLYAEVGNHAIYSTAVMYEVFSQVAGIMVIGVGKCAVGVFLLRIVVSRIQRGFIYAFLGGTVFITLFASITVVVQCIPVQRTWDPFAPGECWLDFSKVGFTVGSWFVVADFAFAILPWFVVWSLNMKRKEKLLVAIGLSLGIFAGACAIIRTVALNGLNAQEYIHDTVPMLIWSATESTVTIMCSSIPVLRPLYVRFKYGSRGDSTTGGPSGQVGSYKLPTYGSNSGGHSKELDSKLGSEVKGSNNRTVITYGTENASDESILRDVRVSQHRDSSLPIQGTGKGNVRNNIIMRTDQVHISYETSSSISKEQV